MSEKKMGLLAIFELESNFPKILIKPLLRNFMQIFWAKEQTLPRPTSDQTLIPILLSSTMLPLYLTT